VASNRRTGSSARRVSRPDSFIGDVAKIDIETGHLDSVDPNDGKGRFTDITVEAGLSGKRQRRTYSACLVDLNSDGKLDLSVVSDFAGIDFYLGDGKGNFSDVSQARIDQPHGFGHGPNH
jgi:hypothetical protein